MEEKPKKGGRDKSVSELIALKDHVICCNDDYYEIKKGEPVNVPDKYLENLKTEKVLR